MTVTLAIAPVRRTVVVRVDPAQAFEIFTAGIDRWWPKTHTVGPSPFVQSIIEPFVGGRWYARCEDGSEVGIGHVRVWEPGRRVVFSWEAAACSAPGATAATDVEVSFAADSPGATRVVLEHRGFDRLGPDDGERMRRNVDGGWPAALDSFAAEAGRQAGG